MKKAIATRWVKALRSGKYSQCTGSLSKESPDDEVSYCCLGVLCEISEQGKWVPEGYREGKGYGATRKEAAHCEGQLPSTVVKWAGLKTDDGFFGTNRKTDANKELATLNDEGRSFKQLANLIEKHW